jgi:hypothetical protein
MTTIPQTKSIAKAMGLPFLMAAAAALTLPAGTARAQQTPRTIRCSSEPTSP